MAYLRSFLFLLWFVAVSAVMNLGCLPLLLGPRRLLMAAGCTWANLMLLGLKWIAGIDVEIRGQVPAPHDVLIAVKHFSMWETVAFQAFYADPAIVMKSGLLWIPFYGWYCRKMEMIAIDRNAGAKALRTMLRAAQRAIAEGRPIVIFPEGTRRKLDAPPDYKPGVAALYLELGLPCVPVAHNSGLYWRGFLRCPGTIVLEYLEPIPPGLRRRDFLPLLEARIETASRRLVDEGRARVRRNR